MKARMNHPAMIVPEAMSKSLLEMVHLRASQMRAFPVHEVALF
jgi:hypothetical protein